MPPLALALVSILLWSTVAWLSLKLAHIPPFLLVGICLLIGAVCGAALALLQRGTGGHGQGSAPVGLCAARNA